MAKVTHKALAEKMITRECIEALYEILEDGKVANFDYINAVETSIEFTDKSDFIIADFDCSCTIERHNRPSENIDVYGYVGLTGAISITMVQHKNRTIWEYRDGVTTGMFALRNSSFNWAAM